MINVLHLRDTNMVCGPGKTVLETACRIDKSKYNLSVGLFLQSAEETNHYRETLEYRGVTVVPLIAKSRFSPSIIGKTINIIQHNKIDIIHSHDYKSDILAALIAKSIDIPIVTTAHGWITNSLKSKFYVWIGKKSFKFFDKVISVSPKIHNEILRHGVSKEKLILIYNAIVADNYIQSDFKPGYLRQLFNIPQEKYIIGNIGRISPEKGQKDFILAANEILKNRDDIVFVLTGDGPDKRHIEDLVLKLGLQKSVFFTGHEKDVRPVFRDLDVFALTSHTEGFPNVVLESLCMDTPVLATDVGGTADIISDHETGLLINPGDIDKIVSGLNYLIDNPKQALKLTQAGKKKAITYFEFSNRVKKIEALYNNVMNDFLSTHAK